MVNQEKWIDPKMEINNENKKEKIKKNQDKVLHLFPRRFPLSLRWFLFGRSAFRSSTFLMCGP